MGHFRLAHVDWPDFGQPSVPAALSLSEMEARMSAIRAAMAGREIDVLVIYGDREHAANLQWATGFDPRFEEAFLVVPAEGVPLLAAGNECLPYTGIAPMVAAGLMRVVHCPSLSLVSQPRDGGKRMDEVLREEVPKGSRVATVGWKYWCEGEVEEPKLAIEIPGYFVDILRGRARDGVVENATDLFMHPGYGLRSTVSLDEIARLEFANWMAASAVKRLVFALREGMTDFEAFEAASVGGLPLGCHATFATGDMANQGLSGPTGQKIRMGSPISFNVCHWGANICRAGWVARGKPDLPDAAHEYLEAFVGPYLSAMSQWLSSMRIGVTGGKIWTDMMRLLPSEVFGITLNPGHLIGTDEWISSPIFKGSDLPLRSGMAMQCDVIPSHPVYGSTRMEDGYVIANNSLRTELQSRFPAVASRIASRRKFMREVIGLDIAEDCLPLADTCGIVAPFLLSPDQVVVLR